MKLIEKSLSEAFDTDGDYVSAKSHVNEILEALSYYRHISVTFESSLFVFNNDFLPVTKVEGSSHGIALKTKDALITIDLRNADVYAEDRFMIFALGEDTLVKMSLE